MRNGKIMIARVVVVGMECKNIWGENHVAMYGEFCKEEGV